MIVGDLRSCERGSCLELSARVRWRCGEFSLSVTLPAEFAPARADGSPFLCASVLLAMQLGEDLDVEGPVSPLLLERAPRIVDLYARWDPRLYRSRVRAEADPQRPPRAAGIGCFLSRGVDSFYSAATPRGLPGPVTHLVFCDGLPPMQSPPARAEEIRLAREAAERLGLPLLVAKTNARRETLPIVADWEDMVGAGLSFLATSMAGGLGHMVVPSSDGAATIGPCGTSPLLDPLFSTEEVEINYDEPRTRVAKVAWLARERPDVLPYLKVCLREDGSGNCGRCSKCLLTLLALEAAGARQAATGFPPGLDLDALAMLAPSALNARMEFAEAAHALRERGAPAEVLAAVEALLERAAAVPPSAIRLRTKTPGFRTRASWEALMLSAEPLPPRPWVPEAEADDDVGRLRRRLSRAERRSERAVRTAAKARSRLRVMKTRQRRMESSRWWRLGARLERTGRTLTAHRARSGGPA